ncbi:MAG: radical SAM protein [Nanoarchaeota archaeon]
MISLIDSAGDKILGNLIIEIPKPKKYKVRKEDKGHTIFFLDDLKYYFFDNISFSFLSNIDGKMTCKEIAKAVSKEGKLPYLVCCKLLVNFINSFADLNLIKSNTFGDSKVKNKSPKEFIAKAPNQIAILLTNECNLRCSHCGNENRDRKENELTKEEWFKIIDEASKLGVFIFNVSGGEPFIRKEWFEILSYARSKEIEVAITSNSTLITEEVGKKLKDLGIFNIHLSLDGIGEVHDNFRNQKGVFKKVQNAIKLLKKHKVPFGITTAVSKRNFSNLDELADFINKNKINSWEIYSAIPLGCMNRKEVLSPEETMKFAKKISNFRKRLKDTRIFVGDNLGYFDQYNTQENWRGCRAGITICAIDSEGNVKGCPIHPNCMIEGNLRNNTLKELWQDKNSFGYNRNSKPKLTKQCKKCEYSNICRGGCKASMYAQHKSFDYNDYCLKFISENSIKNL